MNLKAIASIFAFCIISVWLYSCNNNGNTHIYPTAKHQYGNTHIQPVAKRQLSFFDSVSAKMDLSFNQILRHTLIDSGYFTAKSTFVGDTIYYPGSAHPVAIIQYSDGLACGDKFLLVYNQNNSKSTSVLLSETDCDEDFSSNYYWESFKIFNNRQFYTREVGYIRDEGKKTRVTVTDIFYQIDKNGKIDSLKQKPPGIIVPVYEKPNNIDDESLNQ